MKWFYEVMYKRFRAPWEIGPREELVTLVEDGALPPCRAIDLGCGSGANAIYLAQHGFDVTLDYGVLDDLRPRQREPYKRSILPLTRQGSRFLLWGFEYPIRWWERLLPFFDRPFADGEIAELFGSHFRIETITRQVDWTSWPPGHVAYLLTRV